MSAADMTASDAAATAVAPRAPFPPFMKRAERSAAKMSSGTEQPAADAINPFTCKSRRGSFHHLQPKNAISEATGTSARELTMKYGAASLITLQARSFVL